jgi:hypothetical protein
MRLIASGTQSLDVHVPPADFSALINLAKIKTCEAINCSASSLSVIPAHLLHCGMVTRQLWGKIPLWQRGNKGDFINIGKISPRPSFPKRGKYN